MSQIPFQSELLNCVWLLRSQGIHVLYLILFCICSFPDCFYMYQISFRSEFLNCVWLLRSRGSRVLYVSVFRLVVFLRVSICPKFRFSDLEKSMFYMLLYFSFVVFMIVSICLKSEILNCVWLLRSRGIHVHVFVCCIFCFPDCFYMSKIAFRFEILNCVWLLRSRGMHVYIIFDFAFVVFLIVSICPNFGLI
jgi:hypothetical protein